MKAAYGGYEFSKTSDKSILKLDSVLKNLK